MVGRESNPSGIGFSFPRIYLENRFVYVVLSSRAGGMIIGVDLNPCKESKIEHSSYDMYRENRCVAPHLDVEEMAGELTRTLTLVRSGRVRELPNFRLVPDQLLHLRHVALSGEDDPTLAPEFPEALLAVIHVRALGDFPFFKLVLITAGRGLHRPGLRRCLRLLTKADEVWINLDGGTQAYINEINRADFPLEKLLANILLLGRERQVAIRSRFLALNGEGPAVEEIEQYCQRLLDLKNAGAPISLVQIYSADRPDVVRGFGHLPLKALSQIAKSVRQTTGLRAEVS